MTTDPLEFLWVCFDLPEVALAKDRVAQQLVDLGLLVPTASAQYVVCPDCPDRHDEPVELCRRPDGTPGFFIRCPESFRVEIPAEDLLRWTLDFGAIASHLAGALSLGGRLSTLIPQRLWRLGKTSWHGAVREVLLSRMLFEPDAREVQEMCCVGGRPIILIAETPPAPGPISRRNMAMVDLSRVTSLGPGGIKFDPVQMAGLVQDADAAAIANSDAEFADREIDRVRRVVRQAQESQLADDALVVAYRIHGSYRKAADALVEEGYDTDRWAVERAVKRAGGADAVVFSDSSGSAIRSPPKRRRLRSS